MFKIPAVQNWIADQGTNYFSKELGTKVQIGSVEIQLFNRALLKEVYIEDLNGDTLLYARFCQAFFDVSKVTQGRFIVKEAHLHDGLFQYHRFKDQRQFNLQFILNYFKPKKKKQQKNKPKFELDINHIHAHNVRFHMLDEIPGAEINAHLPNGVIHTNYSNLLRQTVLCDSVHLEKPTVQVRVFPSSPMPPNPNPGDTSNFVPPKWTISSDIVRISDMNFHLLNEKIGVKPDIRLDFSDLDLKNTQLFGTNLHLANDTITASLKNLSAVEKRGFVVNSLKGEILVCPTRSYIKDFLLKTPQSTVGHEVEFIHKEFPDFQDFVHKVKIKAKIKDSDVAISDIMAFAPPLEKNPFFIANKDKMARVECRFRGKVEDFSVRDIVMDVNDTHFEGELDLRPFDKFMYLQAEQLKTNYKDIRSILSFTNIPPEVSRLGNISCNGDFTGYFDNDFSAHGHADTDIGSVDADLKMNVQGGPNYARYAGDIDLNQFHLGKFLNNPDFGKITASSDISGKGLNLESVDAKVKEGRIFSFSFKGYEYDTINITGSFSKKRFDGHIKSTDENFDLDLYGLADFNFDLPQIKIFGRLGIIHLSNLNLLKDRFILGIDKVNVNMSGDNVDNFSGNLALHNIDFVRDWGDYHVDHLIVSAHDTLVHSDSSRIIQVDSDILTASILGQFDEANLPKAMLKFAYDNYPNLVKNFNYAQASDSMALEMHSDSNLIARLLPDSLPQQEMHVSAQIHDSKKLTEIISKDFQYIKNTSITFDFNSEKEKFNLTTKVGDLRWAGFAIQGEELNVEGKQNQFTITNDIQHIQLNDSTNLPTPHVFLRGIGDSVNYNITLNEIGKVASNIILNGNLTFNEQLVKLRLKNSNLTVLNQKWLVQGGNFIKLDFANRKIYVNNLVLQDSASWQSIEISSYGQKGLSARFLRFDLGRLYDIVKTPLFDINGSLFASVRIENVFKQKNLSATVLFKDLIINGDFWDQSKLTVEADSIQAPISGHFEHTGPMIKSFDAEFTFYSPLSPFQGSIENYLDAKLTARGAKAKILEYFMVGQISDTKGSLRADAQLYGSVKKLILRGKATVENMSTKVNFLNSRYYIDRADLKLRSRSIEFIRPLAAFDPQDIAEADRQNFEEVSISDRTLLVNGGYKIRDELGQNGRIGGSITHNYLKDWGIDLFVYFNKNQTLNTSKSTDMPFYGKIFASGRAHFHGLFSKLQLDIDGKTDRNPVTKEKSVLVLPLMDPVEINNALDYITFVDKKAAEKDPNANTNNKQPKNVAGIDVNMNIHATPEAKALLIIDETAGDVIEGSGEGQLQMQYTSTGELTLNGPFEIHEGNYLFTYKNFFNKEFNVEKGSSLKWTGDPYNAEANIKASYTDNNVSLIPLMASYDTELQNRDLRKDLSQAQINVIMILTGPILRPNIEFDLNIAGGLDLARSKSMANLVLNSIKQDENKLNRQVFGLIALKQFLPEENSGGNVDLAASSINTLSEFLSQQLSRYVTDLLSEAVEDVGFINSINMDVGVQISEDQTSSAGAQTQLDLKFDQYLFNNKLRVQLGTNVGLGANNNLGPNQNYIGGDFVVEYAVTPNGQLKLRAYNSTESNLFGPITRTGLGLNYQVEFDNFRDLFEFLKKKNKEDSNNTANN